jgi:hypothetical protein
MTSVAEVVKRKAWEEKEENKRYRENERKEEIKKEIDDYYYSEKIIEEVLRYIETNKQEIINSFDSKGRNVLDLELLDIYHSIIWNKPVEFARILDLELLDIYHSIICNKPVEFARILDFKDYTYRTLNQFYHLMLPYINKNIPIAGEEFENCYLVFEKSYYFFMGDTFIVDAKIYYKKPTRCSIM